MTRIAIPNETCPQDQRTAMTPINVGKLARAGAEVLVLDGLMLGLVESTVNLKPFALSPLSMANCPGTAPRMRQLPLVSQIDSGTMTSLSLSASGVRLSQPRNKRLLTVPELA